MVDTYFAINPIDNWPLYLEVENEILTYPSNSRNSPNITVNADSTEEAKRQNQDQVKKQEESENLSSQEDFEINLKSDNNKESQKSKRIQKREKAKQRQKQIKLGKQIGKVKIECCEENYLENIEFISSKQKEIEELNQLLNETTDKKMKQKIRNRISAQNSRDKKKAYISYLENKNKQLQSQISSLIQDKQELQTNYQNILEQFQQVKDSSLKCPNCEFNFQEQNQSESVNILGENDGLNIFYPQISSSNYGKLLLAGFGIFMIIGVLSFAALTPTSSIIQLNALNNFTKYNDARSNLTIHQKLLDNLGIFNDNLDETIETEDIPLIIPSPKQKKPALQERQNQSTAIAPIYQESSLINITNSHRISLSTKNLFSQYYYQLLQIDKYRADAQFYLNKVQIKNQQEQKLKTESSNTKKFLSKEENQETEELTVINLENALVSYNYKEKNSFSTLFCPEPYIYENSQQVFQSSQQMLQNSQYLHLLMPRDQIQQFSISYKDQLVIDPNIKNFQASSFFPNYYSNETQSKTKMVEIVCKIQYMKEI